jgi:predicted nuclease of predicted toxin-antitoxin system
MSAVQTRIDSKPCRFLVDETLSPELAPALRAYGHDAIEVFALNLNGRSTEDVFAAAVREGRILVTQDQAFLDDCRFVSSHNPGVVVLPPSSGHALTKALVYALSFAAIGIALSAGSKILVTEDGRFNVTHRDHDTRASGTTHYKLRNDGPPLFWTSSKRVP